MYKKIIAIVAALLTVIFAVSCKRAEADISELSSYDVTAELNETTMTLSCSMDFNYINITEKEITELKFNLYPNSYREDAEHQPISDAYRAVAYQNGASYGFITVSSVSGGNAPLEFSVGGADENILTVNLKGGIFPGERAEVSIEFTVQLADVLHRTGYNEKTVNLGNIYPILCANTNEGFYEVIYSSTGDPFFSDAANYNVTLTVPKAYVLAAGGNIQSADYDGDRATYNIKIDGAREFAAVLSKDFAVISEKVDGTQLSYYYYNDDNPQNTFNVIKNSFSYFNTNFGKYPYENYSVAEVGLCYAGMEYGALSMISDNLSAASLPIVAVHETAHQWWYGVVGNNQSLYGWMDEGLAEYSTYLFFRDNGSYQIDAAALKNEALTGYKSFVGVKGKQVNTNMNRHNSDFESEYEYENIAYRKSFLMLDSVKLAIGEKRFIKGLQRYYESYKYKTASPEHLMGSFEKIGAKVSGLFDSWINGRVVL